MSKEQSLIKSLAKQVREVGAGEGHVQLNEIYGNPNLIAVVSVYEDQNPSHKVLDALYDWAEENDKELAKRIEHLSVCDLEETG